MITPTPNEPARERLSDERLKRLCDDYELFQRQKRDSAIPPGDRPWYREHYLAFAELRERRAREKEHDGTRDVWHCGCDACRAHVQEHEKKYGRS